SRMPWYFYLALKQLFPTGRWFPFFTAISVMGVALGVMVLVVVTSVMGGFGHELRRMIVQTEGEVQVKSQVPIENAAQIIQKLREVPGVAAASPYVAGPVVVLSSGHPATPIFRGVDLNTVEQVANLQRFIRIGTLDDLDDDSIILSAQVAQQLAAAVGDQVEIVSPLIIEMLKSDEIHLPRRFRVAGFFEIGHQHLDSTTLYGTLRAAQELYGLGSSVHGINVRLNEGEDEAAAVERINRVLPTRTQAFSWMQSWESFLWVLNLEKTINFFLLLFIVIIAAFSVMSSLLISVVRKTREIGLLGALGAGAREIALCFCAQAFVIGATGTAMGVAAGFGVLAIRQNIVDAIAGVLNRQDTLRQFYQFTDLPAHTVTSDLVLTIVASIVISTLAGLLPAWRAARLKPVEALRSE
ncbi:MAG: ABC transporter permease, partial [Opitutaceae bacterium]